MGSFGTEQKKIPKRTRSGSTDAEAQWHAVVVVMQAFWQGRDISWIWKDEWHLEIRRGSDGKPPWKEWYRANGQSWCEARVTGSLGSSFRLHLSCPAWAWEYHTLFLALSHPICKMQTLGWTRCCKQGSPTEARLQMYFCLQCLLTRGTHHKKRNFYDTSVFQELKVLAAVGPHFRGNTWPELSCICSHMPQTSPLPIASPLLKSHLSLHFTTVLT